MAESQKIVAKLTDAQVVRQSEIALGVGVCKTHKCKASVTLQDWNGKNVFLLRFDVTSETLQSRLTEAKWRYLINRDAWWSTSSATSAQFILELTGMQVSKHVADVAVVAPAKASKPVASKPVASKPVVSKPVITFVELPVVDPVKTTKPVVVQKTGNVSSNSFDLSNTELHARMTKHLDLAVEYAKLLAERLETV